MGSNGVFEPCDLLARVSHGRHEIVVLNMSISAKNRYLDGYH